MQEYENEEALQDALERRLRRSLTTKEWADIGPDWSGPYDDSDLAELLELIRDDSFRQKVDALGGYDTSRMGEVVARLEDD